MSIKKKTKPSGITVKARKRSESALIKLNTLQAEECEGMTVQQKMFADHYLQGNSALSSARFAGYSDVNQTAYKLLGNPKLERYIQLRKKMQEVRTGWNQDKVIYELADLYQNMKNSESYTGAVKALEMLGREVGLWNEKKVKIEHTKVESILDRVEAEVIDITPEDDLTNDDVNNVQ